MDKRKPQIGFYGNHDSHVEVERKGNSKWFSKCSRVVGISHTFDVMTENRAHMQNECENQVTTSEHYASYARKGEIRLSYGCPKTGAHQFKMRRL